MSIILQTVNLKKTYSRGTAQEMEALNGINLEFEQGYYYSVIGKSGCGKSTLLHILGTLDHPSSGQVLLNGQDVFLLSRRELAKLRRRRLGFIFQSYNLLQEHTVYENILMPLHFDGRKPDPDFFERVNKLLETADFMDKYPSQLSGGEQQRVSIARAIMAKPDVILADEPTGNLDPKTSKQTLDLLRSAVTELGQTLILVSHDMEVAAQADIMIKIHAGEILDIVTHQVTKHNQCVSNS